MKSISLFKLFTLVCFLVVGLNQIVLAETKEACKSRVENKSRTDVTASCSAPKTGMSDGKPTSSTPSAVDISRCVREELAALVSTECSELESTKDQQGSCKELSSKYDEAAKKASEECSRMGEENYAACVQKAKDCSKGMSSFGSEEQDGDSVAAGLVNIIGIYGQMQGASNGGANPGCVIENDDKEADKVERLDEKITSLRADIENLKGDAIKEDERLNEKRQKVEEDMQQAEKDFDKIVTDNKTKNQTEAGNMQKKIFEAEKKKKQNLVKIMDLQTQIANLAFGHQEVNLSFADSLVTKECRAASASVKEAALKTKQKFTNVESAKLVQDMRTAETVCLQKKAIDKQKVIKGLVDMKRQFQTQIDTLNSSNNDESKSIADDQKQIEALATIMKDSEAKELEAKTKKLNALNKSVTDLETSVANKKKSLEAKQKAKQDQIDKILLDRQNVKSKFSKVYSSASSTTSSARKFVAQCCASDYKGKDAVSSDRTTVKGYADDCTRMRSENSIKDAAPVKPKTSK